VKPHDTAPDALAPEQGPGLASYLGLLACGAAWGMTTPLIKTATQAGHGALGIALWLALFNTVLLGIVLALSGKLRTMPVSGSALRLYVVFGLFGMAFPSWASFTGTTHLPSGVMSIIIALVPIFALPLALTLGTERFSGRRLAGVILGGAAVALLAAPGGALPGPGVWVWVLIGMLAPFFYAIEGAWVAASRVPAGPVQVLWGGSVVAMLVLIPLNLTLGGPMVPGPVGQAEALILMAGMLSLGAYAGYIGLLRRCGAVFGAQVGYVVTGSGVVWAMLLLGERYPPAVWAALALLFTGLALVQPRPSATAQGATMGGVTGVGADVRT
jgi:drug/metabolite transporter (DMT)-like permease